MTPQRICKRTDGLLNQLANEKIAIDDALSILNLALASIVLQIEHDDKGALLDILDECYNEAKTNLEILYQEQ